MENRIAAVDVGSNAIRLKIAEAHDGQLRAVFEKRFPVRLGSGVFGDGSIAQEDMQQAIHAFHEISVFLTAHNVVRHRAVATSALRDSRNSDDLLVAIADKSSINIDIITGVEEARLLVLAALEALKPGRQNLLIDVGGGSAQLVFINRELQVTELRSLPLGAVRLQQHLNAGDGDVTQGQSDLNTLITRVLDEANLPAVPPGTFALGAGGAIGAVVKLSARRRDETPFSRDEVESLLDSLARLSSAEIIDRFQISAERASIILPGTMVVVAIMRKLPLQTIRHCELGVRDGVLKELAREIS